MVKIKLLSTTANHRNVFQKLRKRIAILKTKPGKFFHCARSILNLGGVKVACKDPSFAQSLVIFANQTRQLPEWSFQTITYMFYKLPLQIQTIEGALQYKIAPITPPSIDANLSYLYAFSIQPNTLKSKDILITPT